MTVTTSESETGSAEKSRPLIVVSADTHIGPRVEQDMRPYCPKAHLREYDEFADGVRRKHEAAKGQMGFGGMVRSADWKVSRRNLETEGHFDIHARLRDLNADGVAAEIIFHDSQNGEPLPFDDRSITERTDDATDFEMMGVGRHIYNEWLADFVSVEPERHVGLAQLPVWDIAACVREVEWAAAAGLRGINFPYVQSYMKSYNWPDWDPFWSACEANGMTLCHHGGGAPSVSGGLNAMSILKMELATMSRVSPLSHLVFGGVFERHPGLRLVITELVGPWWPAVMREMDSVWLHDGWEYPDFFGIAPRRPSEYAAEQVFIGSSFLARFEAEDAMENGYTDRLIWGSDYPHFEGTFQYGIESDDGEPMTRLAHRFTFAGLPDEVVTAMIGGNAVNAYGLDAAALSKVAERIEAPTAEELAVPLAELPDEFERGHHSFRTFGFWY